MMLTGYDFQDERLDRRRALLASTPMLRNCGPAALDDLVRRLRSCVHPEGALIVEQDEPSDALYFIMSGSVRVVLFGEDGREITIAQLGPGACFGETAIFEAGKHSASVLALDDVNLLMITRDAFVAHALAFPRTAINLAGALCSQLAAAHRSMAELALETVEQRLVRTLERWGRAHGGRTVPEGLFLPQRPTHQALAQMVGASRETVTRTFTSLSKRRLIAARGEGVILMNALFGR